MSSLLVVMLVIALASSQTSSECDRMLEEKVNQIASDEQAIVTSAC